MTKLNIVRAWKDAAYFASLSDAEKALVPENPAGSVMIDSELTEVVGGRSAAGSVRLAASCTGGNTCCTTKTQVKSTEEG